MSDFSNKKATSSKSNGMTHAIALTVESLLSGRSVTASRDSENLIKLAANLETLQFKRLVLESARDEMEVTGALAEEQDTVFQRRLDEITVSMLGLADTAAMQPARTIAQLRAKSKFVLAFVEPGESAVLDRLIWSLATELIVYAAEVMQHAADETGTA